MVIRERTPVDDRAIRSLNDTAFGGADESRLIEDLRAAGLGAVELVAVDPSVAGHILFSALDVAVGGKPVRALALAPMAVQPHRQRQGIGGALLRAGLQRAREHGWQAVIVLGHQDYYPRFGFSAALAHPLEAPFSGASFMALELEPGVLQGGAGHVVYPPAFSL
ncbi:putative acetyltransferase [Rhodospirillales bacterium URHD0017]|nr:putative acetyltransferase [Rhodospirillales bacterium URHD0017]